MQENDWNVSYSTISFVEKALRGHGKITSVERTKDILFKIKLTNFKEIYMLLVDEYCLGLAAVHRALEEFPETEYIVTGGNWNGYTREAKEYGLQNNIGVFNIGEFIGSLNWEKPIEYHRKDRDGKKVYAYRSA